MVKVSYKNATSCMRAENPDDSMLYMLRDKAWKEFRRSFEEELILVGRAMHKLKPGQKRTFRTNPVIITIERDPMPLEPAP